MNSNQLNEKNTFQRRTLIPQISLQSERLKRFSTASAIDIKSSQLQKESQVQKISSFVNPLNKPLGINSVLQNRTNQKKLQNNLIRYRSNQDLASDLKFGEVKKSPLNSTITDLQSKFNDFKNESSQRNSIQQKSFLTRNNSQADKLENQSVCSKISMSSKKKEVLRAVSINNDDHLFNLKESEEDLKCQNIQLIKNFVQKLVNQNEHIKQNVSKSFQSRVDQIWTSYINEQMKSKKISPTNSSLKEEVDSIKKTFKNLLEGKTQNFIEKLMEQTFLQIDEQIYRQNNEKKYLDDEVGYLIDTVLGEEEDKSQNLKTDLQQRLEKIQEEIEEQKNKFADLRDKQIQLYENEFRYKLKDSQFVNSTLKKAKEVYLNKIKKQEEKLSFLDSKNNHYDKVLLQREIQQLMKEIEEIRQ